MWALPQRVAGTRPVEAVHPLGLAVSEVAFYGALQGRQLNLALSRLALEARGVWSGEGDTGPPGWGLEGQNSWSKVPGRARCRASIVLATPSLSREGVTWLGHVPEMAK